MEALITIGMLAGCSNINLNHEFYMKKITTTLFLFLYLIAPIEAFAKEYRIGGGPDGGTFIFFSKGISEHASNKIDGLDMTVHPSGGSVDNLKMVNNREADFGITYSGDLYLGREGMLDRRGRQYRNVYAMAYLYGAPAQLVVRKGSGINTIADLGFGKKVAVGGIGTGAATAAERLFRSMGVWRSMRPQYLGYKAGSEALIDGSVDALWVFSGFPNPAVTNAADNSQVKLLPLYIEASETSDFFDKYPFYSKVIIPAGTYKNVDYEIVTFQDSTLLTANSRVRDEHVTSILEEVYTPEGLEHLVKMKSTAKAMSIESGITGIVTPLHKGAQEFWEKHGKKLTPSQVNNF